MKLLLLFVMVCSPVDAFGGITHKQPITLAPTSAPTLAPTTLEHTTAPTTLEPTTFVPTFAPTDAPTEFCHVGNCLACKNENTCNAAPNTGQPYWKCAWSAERGCFPSLSRRFLRGIP